ncbi:AAA family ATPase [Cobetia marina]|uniref:AAA family ATPase n=1 Tax=Cobetia marina TaxID=28258 RepID=UPI0025499F92|nr:AAA family ATPase [Cobetia pacifica]MDI6004134.1 AAA family ATPase [Cobetia pacifica]
MSRLSVESVFTPRKSEVNESMYVLRPQHEKMLKRALRRNSHTLIFGESGNGKSWLYKKVLDELRTKYVVANCANASRLGSITEEICNSIIKSGHVTKVGFSEEKMAEISAYFAKGNIKSNNSYQVHHDEPLLKAFKIFDEIVSDKKIVVLDNLESIFSSECLMAELADIIILLDDNRYAECNVNLLIVGVPSGVLQYFRDIKNSESIANRITEIAKVGGLDEIQIRDIIETGFGLLDFKFSPLDLTAISKHILNVTLGSAQRVHEYCETLAYELEESAWSYNPNMLQDADQAWLVQGFRHSYQLIELHLNNRDTTVARRNQVIFCIARVRVHQFDANVIETLIKEYFPKTIPETHMGVGAILRALSNDKSPLLNRVDNSGFYYIRDSRYLMCIRVMLYIDASGKVAKKNFTM